MGDVSQHQLLHFISILCLSERPHELHESRFRQHVLKRNYPHSQEVSTLVVNVHVYASPNTLGSHAYNQASINSPFDSRKTVISNVTQTGSLKDNALIAT